MKFVTLAYLCLLIGQAVCDLECYKCWNCNEKEENWDNCTEDTIPPESSESTTTTGSTTTIAAGTTTTTGPSHSSETSAESSINSETTTPIISESTTIKTTSILHEKPDARTSTNTTTSLSIFKVILGKSAKVETKQHKCAIIKYKDDNDNDIIDRFCTMKETCDNIGKTSYADKEILCNVCETNLCNKDEPSGSKSIHRGTFAIVFVVAISKTLFF